MVLFACKDYHGWFVEDHNRLNLFQIVHREIVEDLSLNLFNEKTNANINFMRRHVLNIVRKARE